VSDRGTILVVDDQPQNLRLAVSLFGGGGYEVRTASSLRAALEELRAWVPDLILSDLIMGDGSGYELIRLVKADPRLAAIPFIFVTSRSTPLRHREIGAALGAAQVIFRPADPQMLLAVVRRHLRSST